MLAGWFEDSDILTNESWRWPEPSGRPTTKGTPSTPAAVDRGIGGDLDGGFEDLSASLAIR